MQVIKLLEQLTLLLCQELLPYTAELIPLLAAVIDSDSTTERGPSLAALRALELSLLVAVTCNVQSIGSAQQARLLGVQQCWDHRLSQNRSLQTQV